MARVVVNDTLKVFRFQLVQNVSGVETPIDLSSSTLAAKIKINNGTEKNIALTPYNLTLGIVDLGPFTPTSPWDVAGVAIGRIWITSGIYTGKTYRFIIEVEGE